MTTTQTATKTVAKIAALAPVTDKDIMTPIEYAGVDESFPFFDVLRGALEETTKKNAKQDGLKKITVEVRDGLSRVNPLALSVLRDWNFRDLTTLEEKQDLLELAHQIAASGVLNPIAVFNEKGAWCIEDGHRRLAATMIAITVLGAEIRSVPVRQTSKLHNKSERLFSQFILNTGKQPSVLETAFIFKQLISLGWTEEDIQKKTGKSKTRVGQLLDMNTMPQEIIALTRLPDIKVKPSLLHERFLLNDRDPEATLAELSSAIEVAKAGGYDRVMPKHLPEGAPAGMTQRRAVAKAAPAVAPERTPARLTILPGGRADGVPLPGGEVPAPQAAAPAPEAPQATAAASKSSNNSEFRRTLHAFFKRLDIADYDRNDPGAIKFGAGEFLSQEEWVIIRDNLGL
jgi:ParB/RepB/Spo0J family partition protein